MPNQDELSRRSTFILVTLIVIVSTMLATVYTLWRLRSEKIERHFDAASMYARAFEDHLTHSFNVIDLTLTTVADEADTSAALAGALRHAPYLRSLALLDRNGRVVASSEPENLGRRIDRADFLPPASDPRAILRAGPPWLGRDFHDGRPTTPENPAAADVQTHIPVLRDIPKGNEHWQTLVASVNPDYFINYYDRNLTADPGTVDLYRYDGVLLLSSDPQRRSGTRIGNASLLGRIAAEEIGQLELQDESGKAFLTAFRGSRTFPFAIVVNLDKDRILDDWRREAIRTVFGVISLLAVALTMASLYFIRLERGARQHDADLEKLRLRSAALEAAANAIIITDQRGTIEWANPAFCAMSGYRPSEVLGKNPREIIKSGIQSPESYRELWQTITSGKVWRGELINRRKDGTRYPEDQTITPVRDETGAIRHYVAVKQDITERRQSEHRLEELSRHLVVVQESARRRLSGELHDRTSPNLAAIGVNLDIIGSTVRADQSPELAARIEDVRALIADTNASIREICSDLRPPVLDYAGLIAALESYVKQFQRRTGITIRFDCSDPAIRLPANIESLLFRIAQEALTNCAKHSRASEITLTLEADRTAIRLSIGDNGIGFSLDSLGKTTHTSGLGMLTMREMAEFSGGQFSIESTPGTGTRVMVSIRRQKEPQ